MDPNYFKKDLKVTIQALGWYPGKPGGYRPLADDICSVAYWYQQEPHAKFPNLPIVGQDNRIGKTNIHQNVLSILFW